MILFLWSVIRLKHSKQKWIRLEISWTLLWNKNSRKMKYILGHTIRDLSYDHKIEEALSIDFLVLINTERDYVCTNDEAVFYLVAMNMNVAIRVGNLLKKYENKAMPEVQLLIPD